VFLSSFLNRKALLDIWKPENDRYTSIKRVHYCRATTNKLHYLTFCFTEKILASQRVYNSKKTILLFILSRKSRLFVSRGIYYKRLYLFWSVLLSSNYSPRIFTCSTFVVLFLSRYAWKRREPIMDFSPFKLCAPMASSCTSSYCFPWHGGYWEHRWGHH